MTSSLLHDSGAPVLVGRTGELHALLHALAQPPAVVLIEGEAGIGKTRLIREALEHPSVRGHRILLGACHPLREPFPYGPVFDLLRQLGDRVPAGLNPVCGALHPYLPELTDSLPPALEELRDPRAHQHRLFRAVRSLLEALRQVVIVVEDLHWADDGTRDLVRFLVDDPPSGVSIVLSYRREDLPGAALPLGRAYRHPPGATSVLVPLHPLDVHAVRSLTAVITGHQDVPTEIATALHERTAGIPFVLEEVLRTLARDGEGAEWHTGREALETLEVPTLLRDAMADRMSRLTPPSVAVVHAAAVLRFPAGEELLTAVAQAPRGDVPDAIREALVAGVLHDHGDDRYGFRHALAQQAVYESLHGIDRRRLHRRVVDALTDADPQPHVQLAYHARQSGALRTWLRHGEAAAERAGQMGDTAVAVEILEGLLGDAQLRTADRARLATRLSRAAVIGLSHRRATKLLRRILQDSELPDAVRGEIRLNLGILLNNQAGSHEQGRVDTETAVAELRERPALAARGMAALAMPGWGEHPYEVYQQWITRAEQLVEGEEDTALRMAVRGNHLALRMSLGDPSAWADAEAVIGSGRSPAERLESARLCGNLAEAATWLGHYTRAQHFRLRGQRLAAECGAPFLQGVIDGTALRLEWNQGQWSGLADRARRLLDMAQDVSGIAADAHLVLGLLAIARGEWEEATDELGAAALSDPANTAAPVLAAASGAMARVRVARGEIEAGRAEAERGIARVRRKGIWAWGGDLVPMAVAALLRSGRTAEAESLLTEFAQGIAGLDAPLAAAALAAGRGMVAAGGQRHGEAIAAFDLAHSAYAGLPRPYSAARAAEASVRCRIASGDATAARHMAELAEQFTALGATRDAARCRRVLRGNGVVTPSLRGRRGYGDQLSPRERDVARLVAIGHTNREIADVLFLSPRTVEQHVAKVLRKLNVASRSQVVEPPPHAE
ncbi:AAA family ATPase [Streptomyces sp. NPDC007346]|uniref:helix-turn-helix transcriptional regulator n=1 Tax=Streptomyces sp. NPDC007346 TaxID=3154682 RepID=UPI00345477FF